MILSYFLKHLIFDLVIWSSFVESPEIKLCVRREVNFLLKPTSRLNPLQHKVSDAHINQFVNEKVVNVRNVSCDAHINQ